MYFFKEQEQAENLFKRIAELTKEKKHNTIFLVVGTNKEVKHLIQDLSILLQDYDLSIDINKGRFRIKGGAETESQKFLIVPNTFQKTRGLPKESVIYV